jgi:glycosyltransferase involved in cell wall biosynthesis
MSSGGGTLEVATAAWLSREKGIDVLVRAVARMRHTDVRVRVAGDGPERENLERLARELGIAERFEFLGLRDDVGAITSAADVFVHPALWQEACSFTVPEGMASGCAVVASRVGGIPELIVHGETGLLVEPGDVGGLAAALDSLAENPELRRRLAEAARKRFEERFTLQRCVRLHLDAIEEVGRRRRNAMPGLQPLQNREDPPSREAVRAKL